MVRILSGVTFTPQEFKEFNQCVYCGKVDKIPYGGTCEQCRLVGYKKCEMCEIILRCGEYSFYSYDNREDKREADIKFKANKNDVREFVEKKYIDNIFSDTLCKDCSDWKSKMSDICWKCDNDFYNTKENYKLNGNLCPDCQI